MSARIRSRSVSVERVNNANNKVDNDGQIEENLILDGHGRTDLETKSCLGISNHRWALLTGVTGSCKSSIDSDMIDSIKREAWSSFTLQRITLPPKTACNRLGCTLDCNEEAQTSPDC